ncbi:MAG: hypothetical protein COB77_00345 [Gammaproteobacteria bacterium]|nr:MAG: hypothetical protein COB77_00345 [Gammaproteobacteria bacterium]
MTEFKHQVVRDLAWAVSSPPLMSRLSHACDWPQHIKYQQMLATSLPWLQTLDADPVELETLLAQQKDRRLGKYFETLWYYWLQNHSRYDVVENNVQINIDGETLGEIDFILFDKKTKKTIHWELAIKFYLGVGDTREMHNWHGPNLRDRLDRKVAHLLNKQSVISQNQRVAQWLKNRGINIDQCAVILKGRLYFPWEKMRSNRVLLPSDCSANVLTGWWFTQNEFDETFDSGQTFLTLINRGWLARVATASVDKSYVKSSIFEAVGHEKIRYPLHIQRENPDADWDRMFIVADDWPCFTLP